MVPTECDAVTVARAIRPDIITSDVRLLEGDAPTAVSQIHLEAGAIPVIYITAIPSACEYCPLPSAVLPKTIDSILFLRTFRWLAQEKGEIC